MEKYQRITLAQASKLPLSKLVRDYNDAIETIWYLCRKLDEKRAENEALWRDYEDVTNELYG